MNCFGFKIIVRVQAKNFSIANLPKHKSLMMAVKLNVNKPKIDRKAGKHAFDIDSRIKA